MRIPRSYIENYSDALNAVSGRARAQLAGALSQIDYTADVADVREAVIAAMQQACGASSTLAARLAAEFYDGLRAEFGIDDGFAAEVESTYDPAATDGAVRALVQDLVDGKPAETFVAKCLDRIDRDTRLAANRCIERNAKRDPKKPRWARVPTGAETCGFCIMLASRGFAYHSENVASHAHANCDCRVVPSWDKSPAAQGYDPDLYDDMWRHPEDYPEMREAINARRRELYAERAASNKGEGRATTDREKLEERARAVYIARGGGMGLSEAEAAERFDLLVDGNTDAQLRKYIDKYGK